MKLLLALTALLVALLARPVLAGNLEVLTAADLAPERFPAAAQDMRGALAGADGHGLRRAQRDRILQSLSRIEDWLAEDATGNRPRIQAEQRRINELIATQLAGTDGARSDVVCRRVRPLGSNIPVTECTTREQLDADRDSARRAVSDGQRRRS